MQVVPWTSEGISRACESFHMQQTPLRNKPQVDTRLHSVLGATGKSAEAIFKSYSAGINLAGPDALRALIEQASNPQGFATLNSSCGGCIVNDFIRTPLPPAAGNSTTEIMRWLDTDGDGKLGLDEWQLAVELLGITAAEDELGHDVRRMQLTYLASTAYTRLTDINALQVSGAGMLGRDILYEGGPRFHGQPEPMRVVKVPEEARMRSFWGGVVTRAKASTSAAASPARRSTTCRFATRAMRTGCRGRRRRRLRRICLARCRRAAGHSARATRC